MGQEIEYSDFYIENCEYMDAIVAKDFYMAESDLPFMACTYRWPGAQLHWHHYWEILCQIEGKTKIKVGNDECLSEAGDITIIGSDELHSTRKMTQEHCLLILQFRGSVLLPYLKEIEQFKYLSNIIFEQVGNKQHFRIQNNYYIRGLLEKTLKEYREKELGYELQIQAYLMQMFAFFLRNKYICIPQMDARKVAALEKVRNSLVYIDNHYNKPLELNAVAAQSGISMYNFCRLFKEATDNTFVEYLNYIRIRESEKQLLFTEDSIGKIAMDMGFSSLSYFNRVFKKKNGMSPLAYRKQNYTKSKQD